MEEQLITLKTAKLAKDKGFKELVFYYYNKEGRLVEPYLENGSSTDVDFKVYLLDLLENRNSKYSQTFSAPTQSLLQKWLRDVHDIDIVIIPDTNYSYDKVYAVSIYKNLEIEVEMSRFKVYEKALEEGLLEALKLLKK